MKPIATKNYARHEALDAVLGYSNQSGWGYMLTSELDKAHAYQCYHNQELANMPSTNVDHKFIGLLRGADKLASAFGVTLKGFITAMILWPDSREVKKARLALFEDIFGSQIILKELKKREKRGMFSTYDSILSDYEF